jgi:hypothetical protein
MVLTGITSLGRYNKSKAWITSVDETVYERIHPDREIDEKAITAIRTKREKTAATQKEKKSKLVRMDSTLSNTRFLIVSPSSTKGNGVYRLMLLDLLALHCLIEQNLFQIKLLHYFWKR